MSIMDPTKDLAALKAAIDSQVGTEKPQWTPSTKTDFAFMDPNDPAPPAQADAATSDAAATPQTTETTP